jgi:hypothetical protein
MGLLPRVLTPCLRALGIQGIPFAECGLFISIPQVQLWVISLSLDHFGPLHELSRLTSMRRLVLSLARRRLVLPIPALVSHTC